MWYCGGCSITGASSLVLIYLVPGIWLRSGSCVLRVVSDYWGLYKSWRLSVYGMFVWRRSFCACHFWQCQEWSGHLVLEELPLQFLDYPWTKGCEEQFFRERCLWVLFGRGTLNRKVWGVGFWNFAACGNLLSFGILFLFAHWRCGCCHYFFQPDIF